jgi:hypothetical protein
MRHTGKQVSIASQPTSLSLLSCSHERRNEGLYVGIAINRLHINSPYEMALINALYQIMSFPSERPLSRAPSSSSPHRWSPVSALVF